MYVLFQCKILLDPPYVPSQRNGRSNCSKRCSHQSRQKQNFCVSSTTTAACCLHDNSSARNALGGYVANTPSGRGGCDDPAQVDEGGEEAAAQSEHQVPSRARHKESEDQSEEMNTHFVRFGKEHFWFGVSFTL